MLFATVDADLKRFFNMVISILKSIDGLFCSGVENVQAADSCMPVKGQSRRHLRMFRFELGRSIGQSTHGQML